MPREEITSLQAELSVLTLQLKTLKQARSIGADALLMHGSYWRTEAKYRSKQRAGAQQENERLRAQLQTQKQFAVRLVNMTKRHPMSRIVDTLHRYERAAGKRVQKRDSEFDQAFFEADAVLAAADVLDHPSTVLDLRQEQQGAPQGFRLEFRRRLSLPCDLPTASETIWRFKPHDELRKHFIYEEIESVQRDTYGHTRRFQPRKHPGKVAFRAEFLQRRYVTAARVVIVWKLQAQSAEPEPLRIHGRGYTVIQSATSDKSSPTMLRTVSWFSPASGALDVDDSRVQVLLAYLKCGFESYAAFTKQLGAAQTT